MPTVASIPVLSTAISAAVIKGLKDAGVITSSSGNGAQNSDTIASAQESVADVVEDLTGEGHDILNSNNLETLDSNNRPLQVP